MNNRVLIITELDQNLLGPNETWLVVGPYCWGKSRSLPIAVENAATELTYAEGTFTARIVPDREIIIDNDGGYAVKDWTTEERTRAYATSRVVAVTRGAVTKWTGNAKQLVKQHAKQLA